MSFIAQITADISNFDKNIKKAVDSTRKFSKDVASDTSKISNSFSKTSSSTVNSTNRMTSSMKSTTSSMNVMGSTAKKIGGYIAGAFAFTAIIRGLKSFVDTNVEFEQSLARLSSITGAVGEDLKYFKEQAVEMGAVTTLTASQVSEAFMLVGSQRPELLKTKEALAQVTQEAITLAEAASIDLPSAATALTGVLNQFKISAEDASKVINVLAAGSKEGAADIISLNQSLSNVGTVAFSAGLSIEQTVGALEALAENQIKGAEAGTALRGVIMRLQAAGLGYKSGVFNLSDALRDANESINSHTLAVDKDARSQEIFGIINATAGKILTQNIERYEGLTEAVTGTTTAYDQQAKNTSTLQASFKALESAIEGIVLSFNENNGVIKSVVDSLTGMLNNIRENIEVYKRWGKALLAIGATFATVAVAMKAFAVATTAMRVATVLLSGKFALLNTVMMANPFVAVAAAVVGLTVYLVDLWKTSETFRAKFKYATEMVTYYFQAAWINIKKGAELWWVGMKAYFTAIPKLAQSAGKAIKAIFSGGNFADTFKDEMIQHFEDVKKNATDIKEKYNKELSAISIPDYDAILAKEFGVRVEDKVSGKYLPDAINETTDSVDGLGDSLDKLGGKSLIPVGSLKELSEKLKVLYEQLDNATTDSGRIKVQKLINELEQKVVRIKIAVDFESNVKSLKTDTSATVTASDVWNVDNKTLTERMKATAETVKNNLTELKDNTSMMVIDVSGMLTDLISGAFASIGDALVSGDNLMQSLGASFLGGFGGILVSLGEMVVELGTGLLIAKLALKSLNPFIAIAGGAALIAIGSAFASGSRKLSQSMSSGGGGYSSAPSMRSSEVTPARPQGEFRDSYQSFPSKIELVAKGSDLGAVIDMNNNKRNRTL